MSHPARFVLVCHYDATPLDLVTGDVIYPYRPDLRGKHFYRCPTCGAYVGCHPGTTTPLGSVASAALRDARGRAHHAFDPLWKSGYLSRHGAYRWLADQLGVPRGECHIGMFDEAQCARVVSVCGPELAKIRIKAGT